MDIGIRIKELRGEMSREKFAPLTGISKNTLVFYEKNERYPGVDYIEKLLELFPDINPIWLWTGEGEMKKDNKAIEILASMFDKEKKACRKLLLDVLESLEKVQEMGWYDIATLPNRERTALIYTLFTLFSEDQFKDLAKKDFIAGQAGFVYLLLRDYESFTKNQGNTKLDALMETGEFDETNLFGRSIEIVNEVMGRAPH
jgi:transcriptional regulator with XRE-family HTH domain